MNLFGKSFQKKEDDFSSDNKQLLKLIRIYWKDHQNTVKLKAVQDELYSRRPVLFIPVANHTHKHPDSWTQQELSTLSFKAVEMDGLNALGAFTEKQFLINWTKIPNDITAIRSQDLLKIILQTNIDRIVINNLMDDWFFLNRVFDNIENIKPKPNTNVTLWTPKKKLGTSFINGLCSNFDELGTIRQAYFCGHTIENNNAYVLAIKLLINSDNARKAIVNTFQRTKVKYNEDFDLPVDLDFIAPESSNEEYYIKQNSLIYKKALN